MAIRVGINGFGRIGRQVMRAIREKYPNEIDVVAFNDLGDLDTMAHLFRYDSNYGAYKGKVEVKNGNLIIDGDEVKALAEKDPAKLPWGDLGVSIVLESTGFFTDADKAGAHLKGGAKKVINDTFGIKRALMTTVHSYTNDQRILDLPHKDLRRARAAALSIIPTSTGAAKAVSLVIPELKGKFDGIALRVPTPTVSLVDFVADIEKPATKDGLLAAFREASNGRMKGILGVSDEPLVSMDFKGNSYSSIVDAEFTQVMSETMVKVMTWYDNEWGYSCRCSDLMHYMGTKMSVQAAQS